MTRCRSCSSAHRRTSWRRGRRSTGLSSWAATTVAEVVAKEATGRMGTQYPNPSRSPKTFCIGLRKRTIRTAESPRPGSNDPKYSFRMCCNWHTPSCRMNPRQKPMTRNPTSLPAQCCCSTRHRNIGGYCLGICTTLQVARQEPARVRSHATSLSSGGVPS